MSRYFNDINLTGNLNTGNLNVSQNVSSSITPSLNTVYNLGSSELRWQNGYFTNFQTLTLNGTGTISFSNVATNLTSPSYTGTQLAGLITCVATGTVATGAMFTAVYQNSYTGGSFVNISAGNSSTATIIPNLYIESTGPSFSLLSSSSLSANTYKVYYHVSGIS